MSSLFLKSRRLPRRLTTIVSCAALLLLAAAHPGHADEFSLTPALSVTEQYNDNVFLGLSKATDDFVTRLNGSLSLSDRAEGHEGTLSGGFTWIDYARHESDSAIDYFVQGGGTLRASERLTLSAGASYRLDTALGSVDTQTGLATNSVIARQNYSVAAKYLLSEWASGSLEYQHAHDDYRSPGYLDTTVQQAAVQLDLDLRRYLPRTKQVTRIGVSRDETDVSRVDGVTATVGLTTQATERLSVTADVGGRGNWSEFKSGGSQGTGNDSGWVADLSLLYSGVYTTGNLKVLHDLTQASGRSGATRRDGIQLGVTERFTERLTGTLAGGFSWNKADPDQFSRAGIDEFSRTLGCQLGYRVTNDLSLDASYSNTSIDYRLGNTRANQNTFLIGLSWQHPVTR